jgi:hypothetical protein
MRVASSAINGASALVELVVGPSQLRQAINVYE